MPIQTAADSISNSAGSPYGFKNRIINGAMAIDQRNSGSATTSTSLWSLDRWKHYLNTDGAWSIQQSSDAPEGFNNSLKVTITTADSSLSASQNGWIAQAIEGYNWADLNWGTSNAKTITVSFWVKSSVIGTYSAFFLNSATDRAYVSNYTINVANTWEYKTITVPGDTTGTWLTTNGTGFYLTFNIASGSNYLGTANTWGSTYLQATSGSVQLINTLNATWQITGVQVEKGSQATAFDYRPYTTEQLLCYRYLPVFRANENGSAYSNPIVQGSATALGTNTYMLFHHIVPTRVAPTGLTISAVGDLRFSNNDGNAACTVNGGLASAGIYQSVWTFTVASSRSGSTVPGWFYTGASGFYFYLTGCEL